MNKYRFAYSGDRFEGTKDFSCLRELRKFLKTVPEWELKNSVVIKHLKKFDLVGAYIRSEKIVVF